MAGPGHICTLGSGGTGRGGSPRLCLRPHPGWRPGGAFCRPSPQCLQGRGAHFSQKGPFPSPAAPLALTPYSTHLICGSGVDGGQRFCLPNKLPGGANTRTNGTVIACLCHTSLSSPAPSQPRYPHHPTAGWHQSVTCSSHTRSPVRSREVSPAVQLPDDPV